MLNFSQAFTERLRTYGVSVEYEVESLKSAIDLLSGITELIPDVDLSALGQDFDALEWFLLLLQKPEEALTSDSEEIAWAISHLDEPSKVLVFANLEDYFKSQFAHWNWDSIKDSAVANAEPEPGEGHKLGREFLGTVLALAPSGKFHTPWANSNVSEVEGEIDALWYEALNAIAEANGMSIENGEGDPCDLFAVICIDDEDEEKEESE